jgi:hypothetical protein
VPKNERARAGVGCLLHKRNKEMIKGWNFVNERIMTIDIKEENEEWTFLMYMLSMMMIQKRIKLNSMNAYKELLKP